ncbi:MAG TPA: MerR family transcriptional regulator [Vicinamibacterales bacterium]|nr:MerR family transcriptional regulator [Vicinamibacterales bacterium]
MAPKLYRAQEVCDLAQVQPYVLRSWEKEFPGIGVQKSDDSPRLYRQADLDQVLLIKRLVFSEGLTLSGARRKLEETASRTPAEVDHDVAEVLDALASDARTRIAYVRDGLRSILTLLSNAPGTVVVVDDERPTNGSRRPVRPSTASVRTMPQRKGNAPAPQARQARSAPKAKPATMKAAAKAAGKPKRRASA